MLFSAVLLELAKGFVVGGRLLFELRHSFGTLLCRLLGLVVNRLGCLSGFVLGFGDGIKVNHVLENIRIELIE